MLFFYKISYYNNILKSFKKIYAYQEKPQNMFQQSEIKTYFVSHFIYPRHRYEQTVQYIIQWK